MCRILLTYIKFILIIILFFPVDIFSQQQECFLLMAGKDASKSGQVLLAHNNDLSGSEASMLIKVPANEKINILPDTTDSNMESYEMLVLQTNIGFAEGDAVAINQHGVAIAGGLALKRDRNSKAEIIDPLIKSGVGGGVRYYALKHAKSARECVEIIGKCYDEFGISYPSGVGVADSNEMWYMEAGGGYSWVAIRIPNDCYFVGANSYRIGNIDFNDTANVICSSNLMGLCKEYNAWNESNNTFNFQKFFGNGMHEEFGNNHYNTRRVWRVMDILNPSLHLSPECDSFPLFIEPEWKIDLQDCFSILRDYYSETSFDIFKIENLNNPDRSISVWECVHTDVITLSPGKPVSYGAVIWTGLSSPFSAVYIPIYFGSKTIPAGYDVAPIDFDSNSAFWMFKNFGDLSKPNYPAKMKEWNKLRFQFESSEIDKQDFIINKAEFLRLNKPDQLSKYLGDRCEESALGAIKLISDM